MWCQYPGGDETLCWIALDDQEPSTILTAYLSIIFGPPGCSGSLVNSLESAGEGGTINGLTRKEFCNIVCFALDWSTKRQYFATARTYVYNHPAALS
jgi:hypothetical protein